MDTENTKEQNLRDSMYSRMHLNAQNEQIARAYLNMEHEEDPALLTELEPQDLTDLFPINGYATYLKWLHKNKRAEELSRYVRFVVAMGGSTAWQILVNDDYNAKLTDLEVMLAYLTGEHAEEQKMALRAALCAKYMYKDHNAEEARKLLALGKENPEILRRALQYCHGVEKSRAHGRHHARMLLTAMYLYFKEVGTATDLTASLINDLLADIPVMTYPARAYTQGEVRILQNYVKHSKADTPFPLNVLSICTARTGWMNVTFSAGCAFLALRHSVRLELLFRLTLGHGVSFRYHIDALDAVRALTDDEGFHAHMNLVEEMLPTSVEDYIIWCLYGRPTGASAQEKIFLNYRHAECEAEIQRMAVKNPDSIRAAIKRADSEEYRKLVMLIQYANPVLYEEIHAAYREVYLEKLACELSTHHYDKYHETAKQYLIGNSTLDTLIADFNQHHYAVGLWKSGNAERINRLKTIGETAFYRRALVLELLKGLTEYIQEYPVSEDMTEPSDSDSLLYDQEQITGIFRLFTKEAVPIYRQIKILGNVCDHFSDKKNKILFVNASAKAAAALCQQDREQWEIGIAEALKLEGEQWIEGVPEPVCRDSESAFCICLKILAHEKSLDQYKESLFELIQVDSESVQKQLVEVFKWHQEWEADTAALLASKKLRERSFAVTVFEEWGQTSQLDAIKAALAKEKNKKLAVKLQDLVEDLEKSEAEGSSQKTWSRAEEQLAAAIYKGDRKRRIEWTQSISLPTVHFQNAGAANPTEADTASPEYMAAILAAYADMEILSVNQDANTLAAPLVPQELAAYVYTVYTAWAAAGAEAKKRWVLYAAAIHGDAQMITVLQGQIKDWADHSRGAIAADAVRAMALNGGAQALLLVDQMARKFKSNQVKNAAREALEDAASALEISREELEDRIVPDLGFNAQMEQTLDYGARSFTVRLNPLLELEVYDSSAKLLKKLPAPGKQDDAEKAKQAQETFKQMKKQLKLVASAQKLRLEQTLTTARYWRIEAWKTLFVSNPLMHQFAVGLIWGHYENGQLKETFRYMEDGSFNTVDEQEYTLPESGSIGLVHPLELSDELLDLWKEQLSDYEITQPVEQLDRPVYRVTEDEKGTEKLTRFYDIEVNGASLVRSLLSLGWERGEILDGGCYDNCCRSDHKFGAVLTFSGVGVGYENTDITLEELRFTVKEKPCMLDAVSERYFSEIVLQIARIVGDS
ncbi:MAG: DUF4132 domain-containing protein [Lachnospiraceae bacterium]|nr:DUF4132 domain-containing protein [Lachnospiraceae bacterium]